LLSKHAEALQSIVPTAPDRKITTKIAKDITDSWWKGYEQIKDTLQEAPTNENLKEMLKACDSVLLRMNNIWQKEYTMVVNGTEKEVLLMQVELYGKLFSTSSQRKEDQYHLDKLLRPAIHVLQSHLDTLEVSQFSTIMDAITKVGYERISVQLASIAQASPKCPVRLQKYLEEYIENHKKPKKCIDFVMFCMEYIGSSLYGNPRNRKPLSARSSDLGFKFELDDWQYKLVKAVDKNKSVLVRAPTSSGKTFIALYAMEKYATVPGSVVVFVW
jgi:hypothetical protein